LRNHTARDGVDKQNRFFFIQRRVVRARQSLLPRKIKDGAPGKGAV